MNSLIHFVIAAGLGAVAAVAVLLAVHFVHWFVYVREVKDKSNGA